MEADKAIDTATASRRVSPLIANTLETKQQAVHKSETHTDTKPRPCLLRIHTCSLLLH